MFARVEAGNSTRFPGEILSTVTGFVEVGMYSTAATTAAAATSKAFI